MTISLHGQRALDWPLRSARSAVPSMVPQLGIAHASRSGVAARGLDDDGFLADPDLWTPVWAADIAEEAGIDELTATHWRVIHLVRERFFSIGALPVMRLVCRAAGLDREHAHRLFSNCRSLWRIAGLPNPGEEAKAYMN